MVSILLIGGRAVMNKIYAAFIASLSVAIALASNQAFGAPTAAPGGSSVSVRSGANPTNTRPSHHIRRDTGAFFPWLWWPSGPSNNQPNIDVRQTITGGPSYTCTLDVPGDWAHRCPPSLFASPPEPLPPPPVPYELGCPAQAVTVLGTDGKDQTISIVRC